MLQFYKTNAIRSRKQLDPMRVECEKAENACVECGRLAATAHNSSGGMRKMMAAANTATAAAVNAVCIARLHDVCIERHFLARTIAAAKKAEAMTLECIEKARTPVKCDVVWLEMPPVAAVCSMRQLFASAVCSMRQLFASAVCSMRQLFAAAAAAAAVCSMWQLFAAVAA